MMMPSRIKHLCITAITEISLHAMYVKHMHFILSLTSLLNFVYSQELLAAVENERNLRSMHNVHHIHENIVVNHVSHRNQLKTCSMIFSKLG